MNVRNLVSRATAHAAGLGWLAVAAGVLLALMIWALAQTLQFTPDGALATAVPGAWGDWPLHSAHTWWFATQDPARWLDARLMRYDIPFTYPPLINFLSGMLIRAGAGFYPAMMLVSGIFAVSMVWGLLRLHGILSKRNGVVDTSTGDRRYGFLDAAGALAFALVVLLGGGTRVLGGIVEYLAKPAHSQGPFWDAICRAAQTGILEGPLKQAWLVPLHAQLLPQRTFMAGMAIGIATICVILGPQRRWWMVAVLLPLLVLAHTYSYLAIMLLLSVTMMLDLFFARGEGRLSSSIKPWLRRWLAFAGPGVALSLGVLLVVMPGVAAKSSGFDLSPGWMAVDSGQNVFFFWLVNWGVMIPVVLVAAITSHPLRFNPLFITGALLFLLMNMVKLQPWAWDNSKLLLWAMLMMAAPVSVWVAREVIGGARRTTGGLLRNSGRILLASIVVISLLFDGMVLVGKAISRPERPFTLWSSSEMAIAAWARDNLPKDALILSPSPEDHRYWAFALTGRQNVQAYGGWMWTHGLSIEPMQSSIRSMLENPAANLQAIRSIGVTHIAVPDNGGRWKIDHAGLENNFKRLFDHNNQRIFVVQ